MTDASLPPNSHPTARVTHRFTAAAETVFDAWLDSAMVRKWMTASGAMKNLQRVEIDPTVGGRFSFLDRREGADIDHVGEYLAIDRPRRLQFSWGIVGESGDKSTVTIEILPIVAGCDVTLSHEMDPKWADYIDRTKAGWTRMLGGMDAVLS